MNAEVQTQMLTSIQLMNELKDMILSEAEALFSPKHPLPSSSPNATTTPAYAITLSKKPTGASYEYSARLILYTKPAHAEWKLLMANPCVCESPVDALADLLEGMYERAHGGREGMREGDVYNG